MIIVSTASINENEIYTLQQVGLVDSFPIFTFPDFFIPMIEDIFSKKTSEEQKIEDLKTPLDIDVFEMSKEYYKENKNELLKKYKDKHIAIIGKDVVDSDKDFPELIKRVYKKYGYENIFMPYVDKKEKIAIIPSPIFNGIIYVKKRL